MVNEKEIAMKVSTISIIINVALSVFKLIAGVVAKSSAMISDAVHSASDVFSTIVVMVGINISSKASDQDHQYGHERLECIAAIFLAVILLATGVGIGMDGFNKIVKGVSDNLEAPGKLALIAAFVSIVVKELMFWFTKLNAKKINSAALMADAWHHRSDALSSIGSFIGIFGARLGFPIADPIACIVICIFIVKAAYDICKDAVYKLTDKSCDETTINKMKELIKNEQGVITLDEIKTRLFGSKIYVDIEIGADGKQTLENAHNIAENVHQLIEKEFPNVKHCMVHVNPK